MANQRGKAKWGREEFGFALITDYGHRYKLLKKEREKFRKIIDEDENFKNRAKLSNKDFNLLVNAISWTCSDYLQFQDYLASSPRETDIRKMIDEVNKYIEINGKMPKMVDETTLERIPDLILQVLLVDLKKLKSANDINTKEELKLFKDVRKLIQISSKEIYSHVSCHKIYVEYKQLRDSVQILFNNQLKKDSLGGRYSDNTKQQLASNIAIILKAFGVSILTTHPHVPSGFDYDAITGRRKKREGTVKPSTLYNVLDFLFKSMACAYKTNAAKNDFKSPKNLLSTAKKEANKSKKTINDYEIRIDFIEHPRMINQLIKVRFIRPHLPSYF